MSIEQSQFDVSTEVSSQGAHVFRFAPDGNIAGAFHEEKWMGRAEGTRTVWQAVQGAFGGEMAILRGSDRFSVACARAGVILECEKPANVGLVRRVVKDRPLVEMVGGLAMAPLGSASRQVIWSIFERFARIETPRMFDFRLGETRVPVFAAKDGFALPGEGDSVESFLGALEAAVAQNHEIDFGYRVDGTQPTPDQDLTALFPAAEAWTIDRTGWPKGLPAGLRSAEIYATCALAQAMAAYEVTRVDTFDCAGRCALTMVAQDTEFAVTHVARPHLSETLVG